MQSLLSCTMMQVLFASSRVATTSKPNFVFLFADDFGLGDVGAYHTLLSQRIDKPATPQLDRMAAEGTLYTNFHTLGAECSPSRASWLTGRSPSDKAVRIHLVIGNHATNVMKGCADYLNTSTPTVFSAMKSAKYTTGHFGKWHVGDNPGNVTAGVLPAPPPSAYGVDEVKCYVCNNGGKASSGEYDTSDKWFPSNSSRMIVDDGLAFIANSTAPFYLNLWFHISHAPMLPTEAQYEAYVNWLGGSADTCTPYLKKHCPLPAAGGYEACLTCTRDNTGPCHPKERKAYCNGTLPPLPPGAVCNENGGDYTTCASLVYRASQFELDYQIGRFLDALRADKALDANTMVIFSTDNGPEDPHIYMNSKGDPGPYRGRKRSLYDGGTRMPLIVRWPGRVSAGSVNNVQLMSADWLWSIAAIADAASSVSSSSSSSSSSTPVSVTNAVLSRTSELGLDPAIGCDRSGDFIIGMPPAIEPRVTAIMFDYRADGYGACWNQAPRLAILRTAVLPAAAAGSSSTASNVGFKLLVNIDGSRLEMYNQSLRFEGNSIVHEQAARAASMQEELMAWVKTTAPALPGTMGADSKHPGCQAYVEPTGPDTRRGGGGGGSSSSSGAMVSSSSGELGWHPLDVLRNEMERARAAGFDGYGSGENAADFKWPTELYRV